MGAVSERTSKKLSLAVFVNLSYSEIKAAYLQLNLLVLRLFHVLTMHATNDCTAHAVRGGMYESRYHFYRIRTNPHFNEL